MTVVDTPEGIEAFRLLSIRGRLQLEVKGLSFKRIPGHGSTTTYVKNTYGFKGNKQKVLEQFEDKLRTEGILKND